MASTARIAALLSAAGAVAALAIASAAPVGQATPPPKPGVIRNVEVRILSTMLADEGIGEWGFSALIEADGHRLLFDTGAHPDTVSRNLQALHLDLTTVDDVILTHNHDDHTAGLVPLRREYMTRRLSALGRTFVGRGIFYPRLNGDGTPFATIGRIRGEYETLGGQIVEVDRPLEIFPGAWLTGPVPRIHPERNWSALGKVDAGQGFVEDTVPEDMALVLDTTNGLVVVFGCGHAGVINTLELVRAAVSASPFQAVIGGLHLFANDDRGLDWTADKLKALGVRHLMGAHCTGLEAVYRIRQRAGLDRGSCIVGAVGASFSLAKGFDPLRIAR